MHTRRMNMIGVLSLTTLIVAYLASCGVEEADEAQMEFYRQGASGADSGSGGANTWKEWVCDQAEWVYDNGRWYKRYVGTGTGKLSDTREKGWAAICMGLYKNYWNPPNKWGRDAERKPRRPERQSSPAWPEQRDPYDGLRGPGLIVEDPPRRQDSQSPQAWVLPDGNFTVRPVPAGPPW